MTTLPKNAVFPVPPVCTAYWSEKDWLDWWRAHGAQTVESREKSMREFYLAKLTGETK